MLYVVERVVGLLQIDRATHTYNVNSTRTREAKREVVVSRERCAITTMSTFVRAVGPASDPPSFPEATLCTARRIHGLVETPESKPKPKRALNNGNVWNNASLIQAFHLLHIVICPHHLLQLLLLVYNDK